MHGLVPGRPEMSFPAWRRLGHCRIVDQRYKEENQFVPHVQGGEFYTHSYSNSNLVLAPSPGVSSLAQGLGLKDVIDSVIFVLIGGNNISFSENDC